MAPVLLKSFFKKPNTPVTQSIVSSIDSKAKNKSPNITKQEDWFILHVDGLEIFRSQKHSDVLNNLLKLPTTI